MKFNSVSIIIKNVSDEDASINIVFDPPLPENEEDVEEQPCLVILEAMLDSVEDIDDSGVKEHGLQ